MPGSDPDSGLLRVPDQTVEASGPTALVADSSRLARNAFVRDDYFCRRLMRFKAHGNPLCRPLVRLQSPGIGQPMGWLDDIENARDPDYGPIWKAVGNPVGATHSQINLGRRTRDALGSPPEHEQFWPGPGGEELFRRRSDSPAHDERRGQGRWCRISRRISHILSPCLSVGPGLPQTGPVPRAVLSRKSGIP